MHIIKFFNGFPFWKICHSVIKCWPPAFSHFALVKVCSSIISCNSLPINALLLFMFLILLSFCYLVTEGFRFLLYFLNFLMDILSTYCMKVNMHWATSNWNITYDEFWPLFSWFIYLTHVLLSIYQSMAYYIPYLLKLLCVFMYVFVNACLCKSICVYVHMYVQVCVYICVETRG